MQLNILKAIDGVSYPFEDEETLSDDFFSPREIKALQSAKIVGEYKVEDETVTVEFRLKLPLEAKCDRCLDDVKFDLSADVELIYNKHPEEDDGTYPYSGYAVDLTDAVKEEILMRIPASVLCKAECKGLCPVCGANRNRETCGCESPENRNPFAILKQTIAGGANDGSTEK